MYCRQPGGTGELINDIFGSSDEDDEDFAVSTVTVIISGKTVFLVCKFLSIKT